MRPENRLSFSLPYPGDERVWDGLGIKGEIEGIVLLGKRFLRRATDTMHIETTALGEGLRRVGAH